jgi:hypothetical protein
VSRANRQDVVVVACAISAGVHAALAPEHLREAPLLGIGFLVSVPLLTGVIVALRRYPEQAISATAAAILLAGLIAAYAATRLWHLPGLAETPESLDPIGLATKLVEATGFLLALSLGAAAGDRIRSRLTLLPDGGNE